ncbi:MAG: cation diffusion facilitator family transporter [Oligoflexia bacterium]|nr:cation diffusion facilitator family transporter [Oligoflexia bacterium]
MNSTRETASRRGSRSALLGVAVNAVLALIKGSAGFFGNSYALVADAIESASDVVASLIVFAALRVAGRPADKNHPYGHGKFEPLATLATALFLLGAAILICVESVREIVTPHHAPEPYTLLVLLAVILVKETLFRRVFAIGDEVASSAVKADAWHHRSDAITSAAAFVGISIALLGGPGYESADDFAALIAAGVIALNAVHLLKPALMELVDTAPDPAIAEQVRNIAAKIPGVLGTHKCWVRKTGFEYYVDLDILCNPDASIRQGHEIAHNVNDAVRAQLPVVAHVLIHVEPVDDYGRRSRD